MRASIISSHVSGGIAAMLAVLVIAFLAAIHGASRLADLSTDVARTRDALEEIAVTRTVLREAESARRGYLRTRENAFLELYLTATKESVAHLDRLREFTADDPAQRRRVAALGPLVARQLALVTDAIAQRSVTASATAPTAPDDGTIVTEQIRGLITELQDTEEAHLHERETEANTRTVKVIRGFGAITLVALLLVGAAYYVLDRDAVVHAAVLEELRQRTEAAEDADDDEAVSTGEHAPST